MSWDFIFGALAMLALVTFAPPKIAAKPSEWLRKAVAWVRSNMGTARQP